MQKARKAIKFIKLPKVLTFHLKRFELNNNTHSIEKNNSRFEYSDQIDLEKYLYSKNICNSNEPSSYSLHSVIVHNGRYINSGHYYAFIRPDIDDNWLKFNDSIVTPARKFDVYRDNFGGTLEYIDNDFKVISKVNESTAYMLIYLQNSERKNILNPLKLQDIPEKVRENLERARTKEKELMKDTIDNYVIICLISNETIINHKGFGILKNIIKIANEETILESKKNRLYIKFPMNLKFNDLVKYIAFNLNSSFKIFQVILEILETVVNIYNLHLVEFDDVTLNKRLSEFIKDEVLIFYIYSQKTVFDLTPIHEEKYSLNKHIGSYILLPRDKNFLNFVSHNLEINYDPYQDINRNLISLNTKIIIFKYFSIFNKNIQLVTDQIICVDDDKNINKIESNIMCRYKYYQNNIHRNDCKFNYYIEYTSANKETVKIGNYFQEISLHTPFYKFRNRLLIIVVNCINSKIDCIDYYTSMTNGGNRIFRLHCCNKNSKVLTSQKIELSIQLDEDLLKNTLIMNEEVKKNMTILLKDTRYFDENLKEINLENLKEKLVIYSQIEKICSSLDKSDEWLKNYPLLEFVDENFVINYKFDFLRNFSQLHYKKSKFSCYDVNNNLIVKICVILPKSTIKSTEVLTYLFQPILQNIYKNISLDCFYIILQDLNRSLFYDIILDKDLNIFEFQGLIRTELRIQPLFDYRSDDDNIKIFGLVKLLDTNIYPIIVFSKLQNTILSLKKRIYDKISSLIEKRRYNFDDLQFYTSKIDQLILVKDVNLKRDGDKISEIFKSESLKIIIEISDKNKIS